MKARSFRRGILARAGVALCVLGAGWLSTLAAAGCGDDATGGTTAGKRVTLATHVRPTVDLSSAFTTSKGWEITLTHAYVSLGALYYYDGEPLHLAAAPAMRHGTWASWLGASPAWAHPGHYQQGTAMGEELAPATVDLVDGETVLANGEGVSGPYRSATVTFQSPPSGIYAGALGSDLIVVEGAARLAEATKHFRARANATDLTNASGNVAVDGCPFTEVDVEGDGTIVLMIDPRVWLDQVDFTDVEEGTAEAPSDFEAGSVAQQAFTLLGVTRASAYTLAYETE